MRVYILDSAGDLQGIPSESYELLEWKTPLWASSTFALTINARRLYASEIAVGRYLWLPDEDDAVFLIEQIEQVDEPGRFKDLMRVTGRGVDGFVGQERIVMPPSGGGAYDEQTAVPAETAMKHYVDVCAGPGAVTAREVPNLTIAADTAAGPNVTVAARFQFLEDILRQIGLLAGMGWQVTLNPSTGLFVFDVIEGVDHTADVFLDISFDTLQSYTELVSVLDSKTHAVVAGQGEGTARDIVQRFTGLEKTGLDRRETFVDARDVEKGNTTLLQQRGDAVLSAVEPSRRYVAAMHQFGSFKYREHFGLGDLVLLRDPDRGLEVPVRIVGVNSRITRSLATPEREVEIDRPWPTLKERVQGGSGAPPAMVDYPDTANPVVDSFLLNSDTTFLRVQTDGVHGILVGPKDQATNVPFRIGNDGHVDWGSGAAARDTNLYRSAANELTTDDAFRIGAAGDVGLATTAHGLQIGPTSGANLAADVNEVMARNNGAAATLALNADGGDVTVATTNGPGNLRLPNGRLAFEHAISPAALTANQNDWNPTDLAVANAIRISTDATPRTITGIVAGNPGELLLLTNVNSSTAITLAHESASSTAANRFFCPNNANYVLNPRASVMLWYDSASARWRLLA